MRSILHVDMNAYFASVEQASNPALRDKPVAVGGGVGGKRSIVAAASYEAKARGVKTAMPAWEALKICPDLIIVSGDMSKYIYTSNEIIKILKTYTDLVEVFSIDEAFLDVTDTMQRFGGAFGLAKDIKRKIKERFRLTCSIGVSHNKFLAKLAGELQKPDGLVIIKPEDVPNKLIDIPVATLCGVGRKIEKYLHELGIYNFGDLNKYPRLKLVKRFGTVYGEQLYHMGQGLGSDNVCPESYRPDAKSMGHSYTLPKASTLEEAKTYLLRLSEQVGRRLRKHKYRGNVIHVSVGFGSFKFWGKQIKIEDYVDDGYKIFKIAQQMVEKHIDKKRSNEIRFVGVTVANLIHNLDQISIFEKEEKEKRLLVAVDEINDRYGENCVERAGIMQAVLQPKSGMAPRQSLESSASVGNFIKASGE